MFVIYIVETSSTPFIHSYNALVLLVVVLLVVVLVVVVIVVVIAPCSSNIYRKVGFIHSGQSYIIYADTTRDSDVDTAFSHQCE